MLTRQIGYQPGIVDGFQIEGTDHAALIDDLAHLQRTPCRSLLGRLAALRGLIPVAGHQRIWRPIQKVEAQGECGLTSHDLLRRKSPQPLRTLKGRDVGRLQNDICAARHVQHIAIAEVDKDQSSARVAEKIAQCVEMQISGKVGNSEHTIVANAHKAWLTSAVGSVDLTAAIFQIDIGCDEKCVGG